MLQRRRKRSGKNAAKPKNGIIFTEKPVCKVFTKFIEFEWKFYGGSSVNSCLCTEKLVF